MAHKSWIGAPNSPGSEESAFLPTHSLTEKIPNNTNASGIAVWGNGPLPRARSSLGSGDSDQWQSADCCSLDVAYNMKISGELNNK